MWRIKWWLDEICYKFYCAKMKRKYSDWKDDGYNCDDLKFIWAVTSWDDLSGKDANIYTMNDIEIDYDRKKEEYILSFETAYVFGDGKAGEVKYLEGLLDAFTKFMIDNNYKTDDPFFFWTASDNLWRADSIPLLYTRFRVFVEEYKALYGKKEVDNSVKHSKWEISFDGYYPYCLECGYSPDRDNMTDYCPKCGSRMDGGIGA